LWNVILRAKRRHKALIVINVAYPRLARYLRAQSNPADRLGGQTQIEPEWQALDQRKHAEVNARQAAPDCRMFSGLPPN